MSVLENTQEIPAQRFLSEHSRTKNFWLGCADCSFSPNIFEGEFFNSPIVHQNAGNLAVSTDFNCQAAMEFAVEIKKVENIFVCGHDDCEIINSVLNKEGKRLDFLDNWLLPIRQIADKHKDLLANLSSAKKNKTLCQLNAVEQAFSAGCSFIVRKAWRRGQKLKVRALIYNQSGQSFDNLNFSAENPVRLVSQYNLIQAAIGKVQKK